MSRLTSFQCFYINLPIGAVAAAVIFFLFVMPEDARPAQATKKEKLLQLDLIGAVLMMGLIISYILALQCAGQTHPWDSSVVIGLLVAPALASAQGTVRVADYPGFGRVVFEFAAPTAFEVEEQGDRLQVVFEGAPMVGTARRLPRNVRAIQGGAGSATLVLAPGARFRSYRERNRVGIDVMDPPPSRTVRSGHSSGRADRRCAVAWRTMTGDVARASAKDRRGARMVTPAFKASAHSHTPRVGPGAFAARGRKLS